MIRSNWETLPSWNFPFLMLMMLMMLMALMAKLNLSARDFILGDLLQREQRITVLQLLKLEKYVKIQIL